VNILPVHGEGDRSPEASGGGGIRPMRRPQTYTARRLRQTMGLPEVLLWKALKASDLRFRRQHPIGVYFADFYCAAARLVIEVDGRAHDMGERPQRDLARDAYMHEKGYTVLRVPASEVLKDAAAVAAGVVAAAAPLRQSLRDCHLPVNGEDC